MITKNKIDKINLQINKLKEKRDKIVQIEFFKSNVYKDAQNKIGKFFKYRNSYSCPEKESDYWYLYNFVEDLDLEMTNIEIQYPAFKVKRIEIDKNGDVFIKENEKIYGDSLGKEVKDGKEIKDLINKIYRKCMSLYIQIPVD